MIGSFLFWSLVMILCLAYAWIKQSHSYWSRKSIHQLKPHWLFGNLKDLHLGRISSANFMKYLYKEMQDRGIDLLGIYSFHEPILVVRDVKLMKRMLHNDFEYFSDRGSFCNEDVEPHSGHVANVTGERWSYLRNTLKSLFTPAKMKEIFGLVHGCTPRLVALLERSSRSKEAANIQDVLARFTTDVIGNVIFGIECNTMENNNLDIRRNGARMTKRTTFNRIIREVIPTLPKKMVRILNIRLSDKPAVDFFTKLTRDNIDRRDQSDARNNDILQMLLDLRNQETGNTQFTSADVISHVMLFYGAGFETSASISAFTLYELAKNQHVQDRLRHDIIKALEAHNNNITYDTIQSVRYLDNCINEAMRKHSAATTVLRRRCSKNYKYNGLVIEKGTRIWFPMSGFGADPAYFRNPEKYDPDRFNEEIKKNNLAFLPFGTGRRQCIGFTFGLLQTKVGLCEIIRNFKVTPKSDTATLEHDQRRFVPSPKDGVWLRLERLA